MDYITDESLFQIEGSTENHSSITKTLPASQQDLEAVSSSIDYIKANIDEIKIVIGYNKQV